MPTVTAPTAPSTVPDFPALADRTTYNAKAYAWAQHMGNTYPVQMLSLANVTYNNALLATTAATTATDKAAQTASDRIQTGLDRVQTGLDAVASAAMDKRYLGAKPSAPALDNQGATLAIGSVYYDTTLEKVRTWAGSSWVEGVSAVAGVASYNGATGNVVVKAFNSRSFFAMGV